MKKKTAFRIGLVISAIAALCILLIAVIQIYPGLHRPATIQLGQSVKSNRPNASLPDGQGLYESCSPRYGTPCYDRLKQMAAAGFSLVVNYDQLYANAQQELAYAQQASALKMKIIWAVNDPVFWNGTNLLHYYSELAATCNCSDNNGFISYVVNLVKGLPATWGYYVGDEVNPSDHAKMKVFADLVKQLDPSHPRIFVGSQDARGASLAPFVDTAEVIGEDVYPVGTTQSLTAVGNVAQAVQSVANLHGRQSVVVLQAFSWGQYGQKSWSCRPFPGCAPFPTMSQMRQMRDLVLQNAHPQLILWYSFFDIARSDNPGAYWTNLVQAASPASTYAKHISTHKKVGK